MLAVVLSFLDASRTCYSVFLPHRPESHPTTARIPIMTDPKYKAFTALDPFFDIVQRGLAGHVDGEHYFDTIADNAATTSCCMARTRSSCINPRMLV
jgi:hypothetical protein